MKSKPNRDSHFFREVLYWRIGDGSSVVNMELLPGRVGPFKRTFKYVRNAESKREEGREP